MFQQRATFQGLPHKECQEAELKLPQEVVSIAGVLLQDVSQQAGLIQVERCQLLWRHAGHLRRRIQVVDRKMPQTRHPAVCNAHSPCVAMNSIRTRRSVA